MVAGLTDEENFLGFEIKQNLTFLFSIQESMHGLKWISCSFLFTSIELYATDYSLLFVLKQGKFAYIF